MSIDKELGVRLAKVNREIDSLKKEMRELDIATLSLIPNIKFVSIDFDTVTIPFAVANQKTTYITVEDLFKAMSTVVNK